jgi:hypothetical protein
MYGLRDWLLRVARDTAMSRSRALPLVPSACFFKEDQGGQQQGNAWDTAPDMKTFDVASEQGYSTGVPAKWVRQPTRLNLCRHTENLPS